MFQLLKTKQYKQVIANYLLPHPWTANCYYFGLLCVSVCIYFSFGLKLVIQSKCKTLAYKLERITDEFSTTYLCKNTHTYAFAFSSWLSRTKEVRGG